MCDASHTGSRVFGWRWTCGHFGSSATLALELNPPLAFTHPSSAQGSLHVLLIPVGGPSGGACAQRKLARRQQFYPSQSIHYNCIVTLLHYHYHFHYLQLSSSFLSVLESCCQSCAQAIYFYWERFEHFDSHISNSASISMLCTRVFASLHSCCDSHLCDSQVLHE